MPFQLSPGVAVVEKDFSSIVPAVSSSAGAFAGQFAWGPIEDPLRITSENELVERFGKPSDSNFAAFFTAANFLSYTNNLVVARTDSTNARNAVAIVSGGVPQSAIELLTAGSGYTTGDTITVTFSAPQISGGVNATGSIVATTGLFARTVTGITLTNPGTGYTTSDTPTVTFSSPSAVGGVAATATVTFTDSGSDRTITGITGLVPGSGYTSADTITVTFSAPASGSAATGTVTATTAATAARTITGITVTNPGTGYVSAPTVTVSAPASGTTATARANSVSVEGVKIKNADSYISSFSSGAGVVGPFAAKFAGMMGNGLRVVVLDSGSWVNASAAMKAQFTGAPGTSKFASDKGIYDDELHIIVFDNSEGSFSGVPNSVLEKYAFLSKMTDAKKTDGSNNFYKTVINASSRYVWWMDHPLSATISNPLSSNVVTNKSVAFNSANKTLTITDVTAHPDLAVFKSFVDSAVDKGFRQINVTGTASNNKRLTIALDNAGNPKITYVASPASYTIEVIENVITETVACTITSISKPSWGSTSAQVLAAASAPRLAVLNTTLDYSLSGGADDFASTDGQIQTAYSLFANSEQYDISLIPLGNVSAATAKHVLDNVAEVRKDCMVFVSPRDVTSGDPIYSTGATATNAIKAYRDATQINSSYAVMDSGFKYQYDRYNDAYRWVPLNGDMAGLCARTDYTADPWFSPGGFNRGVIKNIVKLAFNPTQADRDVLYAAGVNPVVTFPGQGTVLFGDKTMLVKPSAFDRINVRRLFIVLEKAIATAARFQMFEFNDSFTRAQFKNLVEPFLRDVQGRRGVTDFRVKCDESNNTGEVIDRNEFIADIFVKPNRSINFITLNFVAARSSVSFEEIGA